VFEEHLPETVRLPNMPVKVGEQVANRRELGDELWRVKRIQKGIATLERVVECNRLPNENVETAVADLVVVRNFGDPIYPALVPVDRVTRGGPDKPWHTLINAENFHALELLLYAYEGKVDAIYIDPPYNSGARDWKYSNNYVDDTDRFRHSKWLSFMKRRLLLAKRLLKPSKSFLVVTIDEKEYLRLGLLLEQIFPGNRIQMVSSQISPSGSARGKEFYRVDEYLFFVYVGKAQIKEIPFTEGLCVAPQDANSEVPDVRWESLLRSGSGAARVESHLKFYPIFVDPAESKIVDVGEPLPLDKHPGEIPVRKGLIAVWPMRQDGTEGRWQLSRRSFLTLQTSEYIKIGRINRQTGKVTLKYLPTGLRAKIKRGEILVTGRDEYGGLELAFATASALTG
jgi:adenine-specific DNA-methyltransferase